LICVQCLIKAKKKIGGEDGMAGENRLIRLYNSHDRIIYTKLQHLIHDKILAEQILHAN
jgi:hypothetical protein